MCVWRLFIITLCSVHLKQTWIICVRNPFSDGGTQNPTRKIFSIFQSIPLSRPSGKTQQGLGTILLLNDVANAELQTYVIFISRFLQLLLKWIVLAGSFVQSLLHWGFHMPITKQNRPVIDKTKMRSATHLQGIVNTTVIRPVLSLGCLGTVFGQWIVGLLAGKPLGVGRIIKTEDCFLNLHELRMQAQLLFYF